MGLLTLPRLAVTQCRTQMVHNALAADGTVRCANSAVSRRRGVQVKGESDKLPREDLD